MVNDIHDVVLTLLFLSDMSIYQVKQYQNVIISNPLNKIMIQ